MRVVVDANIFTRKQKTGVDYYVASLVRALAVAAPDDQLVLNYFGWSKITEFDDLPNVRLRSCWWLPAKAYGLFRHYLPFMPYDLASLVRGDVFLFPDYGCPPTISRKPKTVIVHDLTYYFYPQYLPAGHVDFLNKLVSQALRQATKVIAISENTKTDIAKAYGTRDSEVIYSGIDQAQYAPQSADRINQVKKKYGIDGEYILFTSTIEPRKNLEGLIDAILLLPDAIRSKHSLVVVGKKGWLEEGIEAKLETARKAGLNIIRTGYAADKDIPALYSGAAVFAYPSHYEGFGMPLLEAMACGCPVLTANTSSMPEVAGDAAVIVDPSDVHSISDGLCKILIDKKFAQELVRLGTKRAQKFSWEVSGKQLASLLHQLTKS